MDLRMPGMSGNACIEQLRERWPELTIVVLSACEDPAVIEAALAHGASSFVFKSVESADLAALVLQAARGAVYHAGPRPRRVDELSAECAGPELTNREQTILTAVAAGMTTAAISQELWVSEHTVKFHLTNIYRKLGVAEPRRGDPVCDGPPADRRLTAGWARTDVSPRPRAVRSISAASDGTDRVAVRPLAASSLPPADRGSRPAAVTARVRGRRRSPTSRRSESTGTESPFASPSGERSTSEALGRLAEQGRVYPCFCTRAEIREAASAPHGAPLEGVYPGTCSGLSEARARARVAAGGGTRSDCAPRAR